MRCSVSALALIMLFIGVACASQSIADDSAMAGIGGGAVAPMKNHPSIRMVSEIVTVKLTDDDAQVRCEFKFRNEGKKCVAKMGFPENTWASGEGSAGWQLEKFHSWVDGKPVKCVYKQGKITDATKSDARGRKSWYVKDVPFAANQTRTVVNTYSTSLGIDANSMMSQAEIPRNFTYILCTGRNWKGPIGSAKVIVDISSVHQQHYEIQSSPEGVVQSKTKLCWTLTNFEPKDDISIDLVPRYPRLNGEEIDPHIWSPITRMGGITMTGLMFFEEIGASVDQPDEDTRPIVIEHNGHTLRMTLGSKTASVDGKSVALQAAPQMTQVGLVQVPLASVVRALGGKAYYDEKDGRLQVSLKDCSKTTN